jgi:NADP-dependent 3-hydroxy acid dehydrogenase YdfG
MMANVSDESVIEVRGAEFAGQSVVVTGASSGIGQAIATELALRGANLFAASRRVDVLHARCDTLHRFAADLASDEGLEGWISELTRSLQRLDVLVHAAGVLLTGSIENAPVSDLDLHYRVNLRAPYRLTQALLPKLRSSFGQVVFINSSAVHRPRANVGQYTATKAALRAIADSLREEVNADGIRVLTVYPGRTASPMQESLHRGEGRAWRPHRLLQPGDIAHTVVQALLLPRTAEITDINIRPMCQE